jgi:hypothetical protein
MYDYIALAEPAKCKDILVHKYMLPEPQSAEECSAMLVHIAKEHGASALEEIANIHPDKELIAELALNQHDHSNFVCSADGSNMTLAERQKKVFTPEDVQQEIRENDNGKPEKIIYVQADGSSHANATGGMSDNTLKTIVISATALLGVVAIFYLITNRK